MASGDEQVAAIVAQIAGSMNRRLTELTADLTGVLNTDIPDLRADPQLFDLLSASVESNVDTILHTLQHDIAPGDLDAPAAAVEYARRLAQHGVPVNALVRAYRLGQTNMLGAVFAELDRTGAEPRLGVRVLERIITVMSTYIDRVSQQVVAVYERERDRWLANQSSVRAVRVQEILAGNDRPDAAAALNYPLDQHHTAMIAWMPESCETGDTLRLLQSAAQDVSAFAGTGADPLFVAADAVTGWIWIPLGRASAPTRDVAALRDFVESRHPRLTLVLGSPGAGVDGFRRSHTQAQRMRSVAIAAGRHAGRVTAYDQPGASTVAMLVDDLAATRQWVRGMLGGLAADTDNAARLRETVQVYLANNMSNVATGKALNLHYNSVKYRVRRAAVERGRDLGDDRLGVELALLVCRWLGSEVLTKPT